jgi:hypothetical protein
MMLVTLITTTIISSTINDIAISLTVPPRPQQSLRKQRKTKHISAAV